MYALWVEVNGSLAALLNYSERELVGRMPWELSHSEDRAAERKGFQDMLRGKTRSYAAEKRLVHRDGSIVYVLLSVSLAHDADGEPRGGIWQVVDITERRQAEPERAARAEAGARPGRA